jgi:hypothetical protein
VVEQVPEVVKDVQPSVEAKMWTEFPALHWTDVMIKVNKA